MANAAGKPTWKGFGTRWLLALLLVSTTYNSSPFSYLTWLFSDSGSFSEKLVIGLGFFIGYVIYLRATYVSIGLFGTFFIAALFFGIYWVIADYAHGIATNGEFIEIFIFVSLATIMAVGLYWSFIRRIISGQFTGAGI